MSTNTVDPKNITEHDYLPEYEGTVARVAHRDHGIVEVWFTEPSKSPLGFNPEHPVTVIVERH